MPTGARAFFQFRGVLRSCFGHKSAEVSGLRFTALGLMAAMEEFADIHDDPSPPALPHEGIEFPEIKSWRSLRPGKVAWNQAKVDAGQQIEAPNNIS